MSPDRASVEIADVGAGDAAEVIALLRLVAATGTLGRDADEYELEDVSASLAKASTERLALGARSDGALVGVMMGSRMVPRRFRHVVTGLSIAVDPRRHGQGIGRALFDDFLDRVDRLEPAVDRVELMLQAGNPGAHRLYASLGFVDEGTLRGRVADGDGCRIDDVMMARLR